MKVMTFNIQHALDFRKRIIDTDLFVHAIRTYGADVCGLNEVRGAGPIEGYTDQTPAIGDGLGFHHYFGEAIKVGDTSPYGNAIVSRVPFKSVETIAIPDPEDKSEGGHYETRCVVKAVAALEDADVCFLVCHMGLNLSERLNAVETICGLIDSCNLPVVLMGDFNTLPLTAGEVLSTFGDTVIVTAVTLHDILMQLRITGSHNHFKIFNRVVPHFNIIVDGIFK